MYEITYLLHVVQEREGGGLKIEIYTFCCASYERRWGFEKSKLTPFVVRRKGVDRWVLNHQQIAHVDVRRKGAKECD